MTLPRLTDAKTWTSHNDDGLDLHVEELDAVNGTPVLDIKPWFRQFGPRGEVRQAEWTTQMLGGCFADPR